MRFSSILCCAGFATLSLNSCISSAVAMTGKKVVEPKTHEEAVAAYGQPIRSGKLAKNTVFKPLLDTMEDKDRKKGPVREWEVYEYRGLMQDENFARTAASENATSLAISEAGNLPAALVGRMGGVGKRHLFIAFYQKQPDIAIFKPLSSALTDLPPVRAELGL